jgi:type 1 fimbria pilin
MPTSNGITLFRYSLQGMLVMNKFKFLILLALTFFAQWSQAGCIPSAVVNNAWSLNNNNLSTLWTVSYSNHSDTDTCQISINTDGATIFRTLADGSLNASGTVNTVLGVTTNSNNFNISDSTCWCDNLSPTGSTKTCSLPNITSTQNTIAKKSLLFRRCTTATNVSYQLQINTTLPTSFPLSIKFCPLADVANLRTSSSTSQQDFPCVKVTSKIPTCALNIPSTVTLPSVNALSNSNALKLQTATSISIGISNCTNTAEFDMTPRVTFTDANGPSQTCDLKNSSTDVNTSKSSIALAFDSSFNNPICLNAYPASTNNTLSFDPVVAGSAATSQTKNIWAALRAGAGDTGEVKSKLTVTLDYR